MPTVVPELMILPKFPSYYDLRRKHPAPPKPGDGDARVHGPFKVGRRTLYWCWSEADKDWRAAMPLSSDQEWEEYARKRHSVRELADAHRGSMPADELVALLIQAAIGEGIVFRPRILEVVSYANLDPDTLEELDGFDEPLTIRVLNKYRGGDPAKHLWWIDADERYRLHGHRPSR